mgnify:CR=1 FL=1
MERGGAIEREGGRERERGGIGRGGERGRKWEGREGGGSVSFLLLIIRSGQPHFHPRVLLQPFKAPHMLPCYELYHSPAR